MHWKDNSGEVIFAFVVEYLQSALQTAVQEAQDSRGRWLQLMGPLLVPCLETVPAPSEKTSDRPGTGWLPMGFLQAKTGFAQENSLFLRSSDRDIFNCC